MAVEALDGRPVLLILASRTAPEGAFIRGVASWDAPAGRLSISPASGGAPVLVDGSREALRGFDPAVLPRLIVDKYRDAVLVLAAGVEACVAAFSEEAPAGAASFLRPFYGLAGNVRTGEVLLSQGPVEIASYDGEDDADDSWSEPWEPDAPAT